VPRFEKQIHQRLVEYNFTEFDNFFVSGTHLSNALT
jgi:hypothetical protein